MTVDLSTITGATFEPLVGEKFTIELDTGEVVEASLLEVSLGKHKVPAATRMPFLAVFQTTRKPEPMQGTYRLTNVTLGTLEVFMSAIIPNATGQLYQLVFN